MAATSRESLDREAVDRDGQELTYEEFATFAIQSMMILEIERYLRDYFRKNDLFSKFDETFSDFDEELLEHMEGFGVE